MGRRKGGLLGKYGDGWKDKCVDRWVDEQETGWQIGGLVGSSCKESRWVSELMDRGIDGRVGS